VLGVVGVAGGENNMDYEKKENDKKKKEKKEKDNEQSENDIGKAY
jgi:hypothetical protein